MKVEIGQTYVDSDQQLWKVLEFLPDDMVWLLLLTGDVVRTRQTKVANLLDPEMYRLVPGDHKPWWSNLEP